ncbi:hypothetical protein BH630_05045 [Streptococcus pneumoniae]|nr:hypothetical protein BH626_09605 [Streptococcus pneumoniae]OKQ55586.1 hypothetical protein BH630_05045 [Streptococcus pneumoniae]
MLLQNLSSKECCIFLSFHTNISLYTDPSDNQMIIGHFLVICIFFEKFFKKILYPFYRSLCSCIYVFYPMLCIIT